MMDTTLEIPENPVRHFIPVEFKLTNWENLKFFLDELLNRQINSVKELELWLKNKSELEAVIEEDVAWRYIRMNIDTTDKKLSEEFEYYVSEIQPQIAPYQDKLNRKLVESPYLEFLDQEKYFIFIRSIKKEIEIFREENIPLLTELQKEEQKYGTICAQMTIEVEGKEITLQKAAILLKDPDRKKREEVYHKIKKRRAESSEELNNLFNKLIAIRHQIAVNADFENFRDYKFAELGRFDYSVKDSLDFHTSIRSKIVPVISKIDLEKRNALNLTKLKPWDIEVDPEGKDPLRPFQTGEELLSKTIDCFSRISPFFGHCLKIMKQKGFLDLESKKGKAPGGFNYPLYEVGVPFIYMNAVGSFRDLVTMVHEGGHAIHSFLSRDLELTAFKNIPSEIAELASMSMELISMDHWEVFFEDEQELKRAKKEQVEKVISTLPWIATIDKFQHWIYENPTHTNDERSDKWTEIYKELSSSIVDWTGEEHSRAIIWQKQLHLFEVPFYYIEYGFAQLGAVAVWRNYKLNPEKTLEDFSKALSLGYTKTIGETYRTAGIKFDFSIEYVKELTDFLVNEFNELG